MRCVPAPDFTVGKALAWRSAINDAPPYQRESSIWSTDKQQLFVDSLLNGYDVPKIYLHDLRGKHPTKVYAVVDGRQRLTTIWRFLRNELPLAEDFRIEPRNLPPLPDGVPHPRPADRYRDLHPAWQAVLRRTYLAVVLIQNATEEDIEDLFSRLNNGEPLNAAEKRNAMGGQMVKLVREVAKRPFFTDRLHFPNTRSQHMDLAARLIAIAHADGGTGRGPVPDLRGRALDTFVQVNRRVAARDRSALLAHVDAGLARLEEVFRPSDHLLSTPGAAVLAWLFLAALDREAGGPGGPADTKPPRVREFLAAFDAARRADLDRAESPDPALAEFTHLMQHGTNERRSLERRVGILVDAFRAWGGANAAPPRSPAHSAGPPAAAATAGGRGR